MPAGGSPSRPAPGSAPRLTRGDLGPRILTPPPGPESRRLSAALAQSEAPGVNTLARPAAGSPPEPSVVWAEARGANVLDVDGNRFVDLTGGFGVAAVGHRHPRVVAAAAAQAERMLHGLGDVAAHPARIELASRLARLTPVRASAAGAGARVHFAVSGADAVEVAVKTALLATGRAAVVAFEPSYHGVTLGALAATSRQAFRAPFRQHLHPHVHRLPYGCAPQRVAKLAAEIPLAAVVVEPVVGREGVLLPPAGWLGALAAVCRERGALLVADEVFTGFGRTGRMFAVDEEDVRPDLLCCGKALGGGLPVAAVIGRAELMDAWDPSRRGGVEALHTATHLANPPACAAALAVLEILEEEGLPERARRLGSWVGTRIGGWTELRPVAAVRGRGLLWGVELAEAALAKEVVVGLRGRGVLALAGGPEGRVLQVTPPLTIAEEQLETALDLLEEVLREVTG